MERIINHELGFVLRRFLPHKQKISVLSKTYGKLFVTVPELVDCQKIWPGSLISFPLAFIAEGNSRQQYRTASKQIYIRDRIDILYVPSVQTGHRISWVHYLLEICYYFFPLQDPCPEVFELLSSAFRLTVNTHAYRYERLMQALCIVTLLSYTGFVPPQIFAESLQLFSKVCGQAVDESNPAKIELTKISMMHESKALLIALDQWIVKSLKTHPNFQFFKAVTFLHKIS